MLAINATKAINGWLGLISAACFIYAGLAAKNYLSIFEQIAYILTLDLPVLFQLDLGMMILRTIYVNLVLKNGLLQLLVP